MIRAERESIEVCETCGEPAIRRELAVEGRYTTYDTHAQSLTDRAHFDAMRRMEAFMRRGLALEGRLRRCLPVALTVGEVIAVEIDTVRPPACKRRELVSLRARVRACGLEQDVVTPPLRLDGRLTVERALRYVRDLADEAAARLKRRYEEGRF